MAAPVIFGEHRDTFREMCRRELSPSFMARDPRRLKGYLSNRRDIIAVDVGANIGLWTKSFIKYYGSSVGHVYMIDDNSDDYSELANEEESILFEMADFDKVSAHHRPLDAISDFIKDMNIPSVDVLKISNPGRELETIDSASECFKSGIINIVVVKFGSVETERSFLHAYDILSNYSFIVSAFDAYSAVEPPRSPCEMMIAVRHAAPMPRQ